MCYFLPAAKAPAPLSPSSWFFAMLPHECAHHRRYPKTEETRGYKKKPKQHILHQLRRKKMIKRKKYCVGNKIKGHLRSKLQSLPWSPLLRLSRSCTGTVKSECLCNSSLHQQMGRRPWEWMFDTEVRRDKDKVQKAFNEPPANVLLQENDRWTPTHCLACSKGLEEGFGARRYLWMILIIVRRGKGSAAQHVPCAACKRWEASSCRTLHVARTGWVDLWLHFHCHCARQLWSPLEELVHKTILYDQWEWHHGKEDHRELFFKQ